MPFALDVPATSSFSLLGIPCSEKLFVYLSGLQLLLAVGRRGLLAGGLCLLAGVLHRANFLGLRKLQVGAEGVALGPGNWSRAVRFCWGPQGAAGGCWAAAAAGGGRLGLLAGCCIAPIVWGSIRQLQVGTRVGGRFDCGGGQVSVSCSWAVY